MRRKSCVTAVRFWDYDSILRPLRHGFCRVGILTWRAFSNLVPLRPSCHPCEPSLEPINCGRRGSCKSLISLMPKRGLEPPRGFPHMTLNHARLPIPPLRHRSEENIEAFAVSCNAKSRHTGGMSTALGSIQPYGYRAPIRWAHTGRWRPLTCSSTVVTPELTPGSFPSLAGPRHMLQSDTIILKHHLGISRVNTHARH